MVEHTQRDEPYTPSLADGQSYYVVGRAQLRRQITGEQALDITPYSHEFDRMIEAVRAEEREKAARILSAVETIKETGGAVEVAGVRIEPCDTYGATDTTRALDAALATLAQVREWAESVAHQSDPPADDEMAGQVNAAHDVLTILDESPVAEEREWEYRARWDGDALLWFGVSADRAAEWAASGYELQRRRVVGPWEVVPDDRA